MKTHGQINVEQGTCWAKHGSLNTGTLTSKSPPIFLTNQVLEIIRNTAYGSKYCHYFANKYQNNYQNGKLYII